MDDGCAHSLASATPLLQLGEGPLSTILSFCSLPTVGALAPVCRSLHALTEQDYRLRDVAAATCASSSGRRSAAPTPRQRLQRSQAAAQLAAAATGAQKSVTTGGGAAALPLHVLLAPPHDTTTEAWLRLYAVRRQAVVWEGFLPWVAPTPTNTASSTQQQRGSWQLEVRPLAPVWAHFSKALPTAATSALESLSQLVDDWVVVLVVVGRDEEEDCGPDDNNDDSSTYTRRHHDTTARLVTCTQGVALSQRQHFVETPSASSPAAACTFCLRPQRVAPHLCVHVTLKACPTSHDGGGGLQALTVSYLCVR